MPASAQSPIHILGLGNLGKLVAHALASSHPAPPQITLLLHRPELSAQWGQCINVVTKGVPDPRAGFQIEETFGEERGLIRHLIVATKTYATIPALKPLRHRLTNESTILFLQNGMGMSIRSLLTLSLIKDGIPGTVDEVAEALFASPSARPQFLAGIVSHGIYKSGPFSVVHAGMGNITVGAVHPLRGPEGISARTGNLLGPSEYLIHCLSAAPILSASVVRPANLLLVQLEKLAINAVINPLTVIFDCFNGELFNRPPIRALIRELLAEISSVLLSVIAASTTTLVDNSAAEARFSPKGLENIVKDAALKTAQNISSMRQDVRAGRMTEIDYINGYIVKRGTEQGIDCRLNRALVQMVQNKHVIPRP